jgi:hypothetical protein
VSGGWIDPLASSEHVPGFFRFPSILVGSRFQVHGYKNRINEHAGSVLHKVQEGGLQNRRDESWSNHTRLYHTCLLEEEFLTEGKLDLQKNEGIDPLTAGHELLATW